jgi:two-component system, cell cycle sensor histidine kinase and response regulator CckA
MNTDGTNNMESPPSSLSQLERKIHSNLVHQLYTLGPTGFAGALCGAAVVAASLWNLVPHVYLILWLSAYTLVHVSRQRLVKSYFLVGPDNADSQTWERKFALGNLAGGALWGLAAVALFPETSAPHQYMIALCIAGISCGAAAFYWPSSLACIPTVLVELLPLSGRFFFQGDGTGMVTGSVILAFCVVVVLMARHIRSFGVNVLRLGLEKEDLLESLRKSRDELETKVQERTIALSHANEALVNQIAERDLAEELRRKSEERYRLVVDHAQESILVVQDGALRFVNAKTIELFQHSESELLAKPFTEFIHPDDREMVYQNHFRRLQGEEFPNRYGFRILHKTGAVKWVEISSVMIHWDGRPAALVFVTDLSHRREAEEALRQSESEYRALFESINDALFVHEVLENGSPGRFIQVNDEASQRLGYTREELLRMTPGDIVDPANYQELTAKREELLANQKAVFEGVHVAKDGRRIVVESNIRLFRCRGKQAALSISRDITERKRAEEALRESEHRFRALVEDVTSVPVQGYDENRRVVFWNSASENLYGYSRNEAFGRQLEDLIIPSFMRAGVIAAVENWLKNGERIPSAELGLMRKDGSIIPVFSSHVMLENSRGGKEMYCVDLDLTELKKAELERISLRDQLSEAQKMEAIGTLASGIAHDFNNLLQVTLGYSELLLEGKVETDPDYDELRKIYKAARSGAELVQSLLTFCRKVEPRLIPLSLNRQIRDVEKMLGRTIPKMVDIRLELADDLARTNADPTRIEQILMNLAVNARDAMPEGGTLSISTRNVTFDEEYCRLHASAKPGAHVMLSVSDTGQGMDEETLEHIFEPFYTTKELGRGTGLGLAMVYGLVKQHGGHVECWSEVGTGSRFDIYFPAIPSFESPSVELTPVPSFFGTETVMLADDEDLVRELGERILVKNGYEVLTASNAMEAIEIFAREKDRIDLVILDLIMPGMGGKDCLRELLKLDPAAKVLIASGLAADASNRECLDLGARGFLAKPFRIKEMLKKVRMVVDGG